MPTLYANSHDLLRARRQFFDEGRMPNGELSSHIGRSWQRCQFGSKGSVPGPEPLAGAAFRLRRDAALQLIHSAQPELDSLAEQMAHTRSVLILTDAEGVILEEAGSSDFLRRAERVALQPGVVWSEQQCGTNAIGTALVDRQALEVRGSEHFLEEHRILSCAAAPILSSRGDVLGVLDVSGDASELHLHALALVKLAGEQIEHRLIHTLAERPHRLLRFHARAPLLGTPREAVFLIEDDVIRGANTTALSMLGLDWQALLDQPLDRFFEPRWRALERGSRGTSPEGLLRTHDGITLAAVLQSPSGPRAATPARQHARAPAELKPDPDGRSAADATLTPMLARAVRVLDAGSAVLLLGETGVGKDHFAGLLHAQSSRACGPFVAVNCAALPETLIEAELFGYAEGAFTGAQRKGHLGRVREAEGGVLFLDEIGDMPLLLQTRLLRVLQDRRVTPLGGGRSVAVDFALVCATHQDLDALVKAGRFRADLYYRLQDYTVLLPPLRERRDVPDLVRRLFAAAGANAKGLRLSPAAIDDLIARPWPGNLRQLASALRTVVALAEPGDVVEPHDLPAGPPSPAATVPDRAAAVSSAADMQPLSDLRASATDRALQACGGSITAAAKALGVHRSTLHRHLNRRGASGSGGPA